MTFVQIGRHVSPRSSLSKTFCGVGRPDEGLYVSLPVRGSRQGPEFYPYLYRTPYLLSRSTRLAPLVTMLFLRPWDPRALFHAVPMGDVGGIGGGGTLVQDQ